MRPVPLALCLFCLTLCPVVVAQDIRPAPVADSVMSSGNQDQPLRLDPLPETSQAAQSMTVVPGQEIPPRVIVPAEGQAIAHPETVRVPEPFCEVEQTLRVNEVPAKTKPRCCAEKHCHADECQDAGALQEKPGSGVPEDVLIAVFENAAHFALNDYGGRCSGLVSDAPYVIYEGMSVRLKPDGCYEVRAMLDGPQIPAILRLQLKFDVDGHQATVTLPPIRLIPEPAASGGLQNQTQTWYVRRTGYSHRLSYLLPHGKRLSVTRNGTAEIGQIPAL